MATIIGDVTGLQQLHQPENIPYLVKKITGFPLKVKSFRNTVTHQKTPERGSSRPPLPLYHGGGMNLRVRPRVDMILVFFSLLYRTSAWHIVFF